MSKFQNKNVMKRYYFIAVLMMFIGIMVVARAGYIMTFQHEYWDAVADRLKKDSVPMASQRGSIITDKGELLASSLPQYNIAMDFLTLHNNNLDSLWNQKEDSICMGLNRIFPDISVEDFRAKLKAGKDSLKRDWPVISRRISYSDFTEVVKLPVFSLGRFKGGFHFKENSSRRRPYGDLASRTIGEMYGNIDSAKSGIELYFDKQLRGEPGFYNRRKVLRDFLNVTVKEPIDGLDIVSTIDINIQDLAERSLRNKLQEIEADLGVAIVMETATGDIKAMTSLKHCSDGVYREVQNDAVNAMVEPGSVFKTASIMLALEDGYIDTLRKVDTGNGIWPIYGCQMRDHNYHKGGYHTLSVPQILMYSSNIGVSKIIDQYYHKQPEKYVDGLKRIGMGIELQLPFFFDPKTKKPIKTKPNIRRPHKNSHGQYDNWSNTALPWMSIGYESQVPPIYTVSFYNAIANHGRYMQPRFVKEIRKDGEVVEKFEPVCLINKIASDKTIGEVTRMLEKVVSVGLGRKAGSDKFSVAGKTGTAQVADKNGYKAGGVCYWVSFCGFFPTNDPKYSCIVCIKKKGAASGGGMCGPVFREIAEGVMAQNIMYDITQSKDAHSVLFPEVKSGNLLAADFVLAQLGLKANQGWNGAHAKGTPVWGYATTTPSAVAFSRKETAPRDQIPDVSNMGARDAVYLLESRGVKVSIEGRGKVKQQSISPGTKITRGMQIKLVMG